MAENLLGAEVIHSWHVFADISLHGVRFPRAGLPISKTGDLRSLEGIMYKWSNRLLIDLFILRRLVKSKVEVESSFLKVFGEIDLDST